MKKDDKKRPIPFVRRLCAHLSEEEIEAAEERMRQYITLALQIHSRNAKNPDENRPDLAALLAETSGCKPMKNKNCLSFKITKASSNY